MMNPETFFSFADRHPAVAIVTLVASVAALGIAYQFTALVLDSVLAIIGRPRTVRTLQERVQAFKEIGTRREPREPKETKETKSKQTEKDTEETAVPNQVQVRGALKELGYTRPEIDRIWDFLDLSQPMPIVMKTALRNLSIFKEKEVA